MDGETGTTRLSAAVDGALALSAAWHEHAESQRTEIGISIQVGTLTFDFDVVNGARLYVWLGDRLMDSVAFASPTPSERAYILRERNTDGH